MTRLKSLGTAKVRLTLHLTPPAPIWSAGSMTRRPALLPGGNPSMRRSKASFNWVSEWPTVRKAAMLRAVPLRLRSMTLLGIRAMIRRLACLVVAILLLSTPVLMADGPADNVASSVRRIPKAGVKIAGEVREELEGKLAEFRGDR